MLLRDPDEGFRSSFYLILLTRKQVGYMLSDNHQKIFYFLTEKGKELYDEHEQRHNLWLKRDDDFLKQYDQKYLAQIQEFMEDFNHYLEEKIIETGEREDAN